MPQTDAGNVEHAASTHTSNDTVASHSDSSSPSLLDLPAYIWPHMIVPQLSQANRRLLRAASRGTYDAVNQFIRSFTLTPRSINRALRLPLHEACPHITSLVLKVTARTKLKQFLADLARFAQQVLPHLHELETVDVTGFASHISQLQPLLLALPDGVRLQLMVAHLTGWHQMGCPWAELARMHKYIKTHKPNTIIELVPEHGSALAVDTEAHERLLSELDRCACLPLYIENEDTACLPLPESLQGHTLLTRLALDLEVAAALTQLGKLTQLECLELYYGYVSHAELAPLAACTRLTRLVVESLLAVDPAFWPTYQEQMVAIPSLRCVVTQGVLFGPLRFTSLWPNVTEVDMQVNEAHEQHTGDLRVLRGLQHLRTLTLRIQRFIATTIKFPMPLDHSEVLASLKSLRELRFVGWSPRTEQALAAVAAAVAALPQLTQLEFNSCTIVLPGSASSSVGEDAVQAKHGSSSLGATAARLAAVQLDSTAAAVHQQHGSSSQIISQHASPSPANQHSPTQAPQHGMHAQGHNGQVASQHHLASHKSHQQNYSQAPQADLAHHLNDQDHHAGSQSQNVASHIDDSSDSMSDQDDYDQHDHDSTDEDYPDGGSSMADLGSSSSSNSSNHHVGPQLHMPHVRVLVISEGTDLGLLYGLLGAARFSGLTELQFHSANGVSSSKLKRLLRMLPGVHRLVVHGCKGAKQDVLGLPRTLGRPDLDVDWMQVPSRPKASYYRGLRPH